MFILSYIYTTNNTGAGGYHTVSSGAGTSVGEMNIRDPITGEMLSVAEAVIFLKWFIETYYPDAESQFNAVRDVQRKAHEQHSGI